MTAPLRELRILSRLAIPVVLGNVGTMMLHVVDTMMVGDLSTEALAAAALGGLWTSGTILFAMGLVMGIDPIVSQAHGAGDSERSSLALQRGLILGLAAGVVVAVFWHFSKECLLLLGQEPELAHTAQAYVRAQIFSIPFFMAFVALREYLQCREIMSPIMYVTIAANGFNWAANKVLIFGYGSFEGLGLQGAGIATGLSRVFMLAGLLLAIRWFGLHKGGWNGWSREAFSKSGLVEVLKHGIPAGLHIGLEVWAFCSATVMAGILTKQADDPNILAAHQVVMNIASMTFMLPMGVSFGVVTRVGNLIGRREFERAQHAAWVALGLGAGSMCLCAMFLYLARFQIPLLYDLRGGGQQLAAGILPIAATFQIFDGLQVVGSGILRGMGRTHVSAFINLFGYWALAIPLAAFMAFQLDMGLHGVWWGLFIGLFVVASTLVTWIRSKGPGSLTSIPTMSLDSTSS